MMLIIIHLYHCISLVSVYIAVTSVWHLCGAHSLQPYILLLILLLTATATTATTTTAIYINFNLYISPLSVYETFIRVYHLYQCISRLSMHITFICVCQLYPWALSMYTTFIRLYDLDPVWNNCFVNTPLYNTYY